MKGPPCDMCGHRAGDSCFAYEDEDGHEYVFCMRCLTEYAGCAIGDALDLVVPDAIEPESEDLVEGLLECIEKDQLPSRGHPVEKAFYLHSKAALSALAWALEHRITAGWELGWFAGDRLELAKVVERSAGREPNPWADRRHNPFVLESEVLESPMLLPELVARLAEKLDEQRTKKKTMGETEQHTESTEKRKPKSKPETEPKKKKQKKDKPKKKKLKKKRPNPDS